MEVEAKYSVPDHDTFQRLLGASSLSGFNLSEPSRALVRDRYLDTADLAFCVSGYACRLRRKNHTYVATLKGLGTSKDAVHRRVELEVGLSEPLPPMDWPPSAARDLALSLSAGQSLANLFEVEQTRYSRLVSASDQAVAELSLDQVTLRSGSATADPFLELEIELLAMGSEGNLAGLMRVLEREWGLLPEVRSKYERGLAFIGARVCPPPKGAEALEPRLTEEERAVVERLAQEREVLARRARLLLAWDDCLDREELIRLSALSARRVRYWLHAFRRERMAVFPQRALQTAVDALDAPVATPVWEPVARPGQAGIGKGTPEVRPRRAPGTRPGVAADDPMSEAGRKILGFHFDRFLAHEPGTRLGEDIEELHDMRVASRRMRAAFRVFGPSYEPEKAARYRKGLRRAGRALGAVRDLDVFLAKVQDYISRLPEDQQHGLDILLTALAQQREGARQQMIACLDSKKHRRIVERFGAFVATESRDSLPVEPAGMQPRPYRVRHVAPIVVQQRLAALQAYDEWVVVADVPLERLHALRIACKRLRYTLEFFREILGSGTRQLIRELVTLQDHLGSLQDAVVASELLRDFLVWGTWGRYAGGDDSGSPVTTVDARGVALYLAYQQSELQRLLEGFPEIWQVYAGTEFARKVAAAAVVG